MTPVPTLDYAPRTEFDTGRFAARYLQALAWISIASMIAAPIFFGGIYVDVSPVLLFWFASALKRHSSTARKWVLATFSLMLGMLVLFLALSAIGRPPRMLASAASTRIVNPSLRQFALAAIPMILILGIPFGVLLTPRARRQFGHAKADG